MAVHDFRSDTVTLPTKDMMRAIAHADLGDAARGDDPTVNALEARAAEMMGKESALFLPSGVMANLSAIMAHGGHGHEVIVEASSHIYNSEGGGVSVVAGAVVRPVKGNDGALDPRDVMGAIQPGGELSAAPRLICLENTHNAAGGRVIPLEVVSEIGSAARGAGVSVHLDGARLFNAAVFLDQPISALCADVDSVMVSMCKGLGGPVGAILAGDRAFMRRARKAARMLGGGMRQAGLLAAPVLLALENPYPAHRYAHDLARLLAEGLAAIDDGLVDPAKVETNIVNCFVDRFAENADAIVDALKQMGVLANHKGAKIRFVTHQQLDEAAVEAAVDAFGKIIKSFRRAA